MKKLLSVLLAIVMVCGTMTLGFTTVFAAEDVESLSIGASSGTTGDCTWSLTDQGLLVIEGEGKMEDYGIFTDCAPWGTDIKNVIIENGVTNIGTNAFYSCSNIERVTFPKTLTTIGNGAFCGCSSIKSISLARTGVTTIGSQAFCACDSLEEIHFPDSVTSIGDWAFCSCSGLTSVSIPDSVTSIGYGTFDGCISLKSVTIPKSLTYISTYAFLNCTALTSVTIPNSIDHIADGAFFNCTALKSVTIPNSVNIIGGEAFGYYMDDVTSEYKKVEGFTIYGFKYSEGERYALNNRFNFIAITETVSGTTGDCMWTRDNKGKLTISGNGAMEDYNHTKSAPWGKWITELVIEKGVTNIGNYAFYNCASLISITIPDSVTSIGESTFDGCAGLTSIAIPDSVTSISPRAFLTCNALKSVTIPNSVNFIGWKAFGYSDDSWDLNLMKTVEGFTIYGLECSKAEIYANNNGFSFVPLGEEKTIVFGDSNGDGVVDILDAAKIQKYASKRTSLTNEKLELADVNNDGFVDVLDAVTIQKYAAGKITEFTKAA